MPEFESFGKTILIAGIILVIIGALLCWGGKFAWLGKLPGDIHIERGNYSIYFPIVTSIILSIIVTVILNIFFRR